MSADCDTCAKMRALLTGKASLSDLFGSRAEAHKRVSEMAGLDESGAILPPPEGAEIDRTPNEFWRNRT